MQKYQRHRLGILFLIMISALFLKYSESSAQERVGPTSSDLRLQWYQEHVSKKATSPFKNLEWQFIGPTNISGRVTDVAVMTPRGRTYTIFAAAASGGLWKTENEGTTWEPVFEHGPSTSIGDVAVAPSDEDIVWIGLGEANIFRSSMAGAGLMKSTDRGSTWDFMGLAGTHTIARIVIHPDNPDIIYVAASGHEWTNNEERGVYKTSDGGETWEKILYIDDKTGAIDLVIDPVDSNTLYAAFWQRIRKKWNDPRNEPNYSGSGLYKTIDGGLNWSEINSGLPHAEIRGRIGIDVSQSNPDVLYAFVDNYETAEHKVPTEREDGYGTPNRIIKGATIYRSDNKGQNWRQVSESSEYMEDISSTYGWVFGQIRVDPNDENTVYVMGIDLNVSYDGGKTFKPLEGMHGDHHALWIDPDNSDYLVNGNDGGIAISYDSGQTWKTFYDNLPVVQFFNIAYDMDDPFHVYGSVQDHGSYRGIIDLKGENGSIDPVPYERAPGGEGSSHAVNPINPDIVYSAGFYGRIQRTDYGQRDENNRPKTEQIFPRTEAGEQPLRGQWVAPFTISPHHPDVIYHGMQYLYRSKYRGLTFERISPDLTYNDPDELGDIRYQTILSISESPLKYGLIYTGTDDGKVHVTDDGGKSWSEIMKGLPYKKSVSRIVSSAFREGTVYMAQNGKRDDDFTPYLWKSDNYGKKWEDLSRGIPSGPVNVIREDPHHENILYTGTDLGVYVSRDRGDSWHNLSNNLPTTYVHDLIVHPRENIMVIATHGRGMYALDVEQIQNYKPE